MVFGMATTKVTITLQDDQVGAIREFVAGGKASSVSGFVQHAVNVALFDAAGWRTMLDDALRQTGGSLTREERAWADTLLRPRARRERKTGAGRGSTRRSRTGRGGTGTNRAA
jgi:Arc/MetJ-type ribon-helix-helix transcriptional regulator